MYYYNPKTGEYPPVPKGGKRYLTISNGGFLIRTMGVVEKGVKKGRLGQVGVSNHSPETAFKILGWEKALVGLQAKTPTMNVDIEPHKDGGYKQILPNGRVGWPRTKLAAQKRHLYTLLENVKNEGKKGRPTPAEYALEAIFLLSLDNL